MFKKNAWVAGLLAVLVMMFFGCIDAEPEDTNPVVEVARLSKVIADAPVGRIADDAAWNAIFDGSPFMRCGGNPDQGLFSIIEELGVKKLSVDEMVASWGVGIDIYNNSFEKGVGAGFRPGDEITVVGYSKGADFIINVKPSGENGAEGWASAGGDFDKTVTLTAAHVGDIRVSNPQAVRLHYKNGAANGRQAAPLVFEEIVIKGKRGGTTDVFADDFEYSDVAQITGWVSGVTIKPKAGKTAGKITQYFEGAGATTYAKSTTVPQALGEYKVTFDVAAAKGFNAATDVDPEVTLLVLATKPASEVVFNNATAWTGFAFEGAGANFINGPSGEGLVFLYNGVTQDNLDVATPIPLQSAILGGTPRIVYQITKSGWKTAGYKEVVITYNIIDTSLSTGGNNVIVRANAGATYSNQGGDRYDDLKVGTGNTLTLPIAWFSNGTGSDGFSFTKNHGGTGILIKITKVELIGY